MLLLDYQVQIAKTRETIRSCVYNSGLLSRCTSALKAEQQGLRKARSRLQRSGLITLCSDKYSLDQVFSHVVNNSAPGRRQSHEDLLMAYLDYMAATRVISYLSERVAAMKKNNRDPKPFELQEKEILEDIEEMKGSGPAWKVSCLGGYLIKAEDLKIDISQAKSAMDLGEKARGHLIALTRKSRQIISWGNTIFELNSDTPNGQFPNQLFDHAIEAHVLLCAFKNEVGEFWRGRDLSLHFDAISGFKSGYFKNLILDWRLEKKIKSSLFYVKVIVNSLEAMLKGLNSKIVKMEGERELINHELGFIMQKHPGTGN